MTDLNANAVNNNYTPAVSHVVSSRAFVRVEFGYTSLPSIPTLNTILVEFHGGQQYLYVGVGEALYLTLRSAVETHIQTNGEYRIGSQFARSLFNNFQAYARLNQG